MINAKYDFIKRVEEINRYFDFLKIIDLKPSSIVYTELMGGVDNFIVDDELVKILKANGFILLYNLVECTVIKSVTAIFDEISNEGLTFSGLSEKIKTLWVNDKTTILKGVDDINFPKIRLMVREVAESILTTEVTRLQSSCLSISGNMDAHGIRDVANKVGFDAISDGRHLLKIKEKRNQLAHGELSFGDVGKDHSVNDMLIYKDDAVAYLNEVMKSVENYIISKSYAA